MVLAIVGFILQNFVQVCIAFVKEHKRIVVKTRLTDFLLSKLEHVIVIRYELTEFLLSKLLPVIVIVNELME